MDVKFESQEECVRTYAASATADEVLPYFKEAVTEIRAKVSIPGFRPGKVPTEVIRGRFRKEIRDEVLEHLLPKLAAKAKELDAVEPVVDPYASDIELEEGKPFAGKLHFEVVPEVPATPDLTVSVTVPKLPVSEDMVQRQLRALKEDAAVVQPVEVAEEGDLVQVSLTRRGQSKPFTVVRAALAQSDHPMDPLLLGKKVDETFEFSVAEDAPTGTGKLAAGDYRGTITRLARRRLPETDEDLAKHYGQETFDGLRSGVLATLQAEADRRSRRLQEEKALAALLDRHPFPVPPSLVERQLRSNLEEIAESLARQGVDLKKADLKWDEIAGGRRPEAEGQVRTYFFLEALSMREGIQVTEEEVDAHIGLQARASGSQEVDAKKLRQAYEKQGRLGSVRRLLAHRKVLDLILSKASVTLEEGHTHSEEDAHAPHTHGGGADEPR